MIERIRECCKNGNIVWTPHAVTRMMDRSIREGDKINALFVL